MTDFDEEGDSGRTIEAAGSLPGSPSASRRRLHWNESIELFLRWKRSEARVGEDWIRRMRWELCRFPGLLDRIGRSPAALRPETVGPEAIEELRERLPWEKSTFQLQYAALRQFFAWAGNPIASRKSVWALPSGNPTHRRWLAKDQLIRLYRSSLGGGRLLVALEGFNGLRRIEVLRLRAKDVGLGENCLRVLGKGRNGGKWRMIPIYPLTRALLERALNGLGPTDRLIPLSSSGADYWLARAAAAAGLTAEGVKISHHDLRRTFGRLAYGAGMDLVQLKNLLGHTSIEMTVHYIGLDADTMRAGLERLDHSIGRLE